MKILFLTTPHPTFRHWQSVELNAAVLIEALCGLGHEVSWATADNINDYDEASLKRLTDKGATWLGDYSSDLVRWPKGGFARRWTLIKSGVGRAGSDTVQIRDPKRLANRLLRESGAEIVLLFWDAVFEHLLPHLSVPSVAYLARPPYAAAQASFETGKDTPTNPIARFLVGRHLAGWRRRHLNRIATATIRTDICALDAAYYSLAGMPCTYLPNTWPDPIGDGWESARRDAESHNTFPVLGALGLAIASGTMQGIRFWATEVLPALDRRMGDEPSWTISVCGRDVDKLPPDILARLDHPRIVIKGFVDDIDHEVLSSPVFLMCNNAGTYTGGYTRVIYAMATGACMIAHKRLADSMPEVRHGENALLGETGEEIAALVEQAYRDPDLRKHIGRGARKTYETEYHPDAIARRLIECGQNALSVSQAGETIK